jgi:hypothetical protein
MIMRFLFSWFAVVVLVAACHRAGAIDTPTNTAQHAYPPHQVECLPDGAEAIAARCCSHETQTIRGRVVCCSGTSC